jgi:hypothetical protein
VVVTVEGAAFADVGVPVAAAPLVTALIAARVAVLVAALVAAEVLPLCGLCIESVVVEAAAL